MGFVLNQSDVVRLMEQPSPHVRAIVASKLSLAVESPDLSNQELGIAKDIIRKMATDVEIIVRLAIAKNLRHSQHLPHDVAVKLAYDIEAVALPILADSIILTDDDLIEILASSSLIKEKAIASRPHVSEKLSDAIITKANEAAVAVLMDNKGANIADTSFDKAINRFTTSDIVKQSMVMHPHLPTAAAERLAVMVSEKLQNYLVAHHNLPPALTEEITVRSREMAVIWMNRYTSLEEIEHLVYEMHRKSRLTPSIIMRALCAGNLVFFEFALAELARISVMNARTLIHDPGKNALESLCAKAQLPFNYIPVIRIALNAREGLAMNGNEDDMKRYRVRIIERILTQSDSMDDKETEFFLDLINDQPTQPSSASAPHIEIPK